MTLEELLAALGRYRRQLAPLMGAWAATADDAARELIDLLVVSDRELGSLCHLLSQHIGGADQPHPTIH